MISADTALQRLREGNERFVNGTASWEMREEHRRREEFLQAQEPFAILLGCSDSRVPGEMVFDQGLGDLFVIRVAGNIVARSQIGSIEFAAEQFGARLVVVMGHSHCGAVKAALAELEQDQGNRSPNLEFIVDRIKPGIQPLVQELTPDNREDIEAKAVKANVLASVRQLRSGSEVLEQLIREQGLKIVGARYALETGRVEFFDVP